MSGKDPTQDPIHPLSLLLPWYINGTLAVDERQQVDEHLRECPECRSELEALAGLSARMKSAWADRGSAAPELRSRVLSQVSAGSVVSLTDARARLRQSPQDLPRLRARSILPVMAASLIVIQFSAILWMLRPQPQVTHRGISSPETKIKIVFQPSATESDIRAALGELHARIVDGPDGSAAYTLQLTNDRPADNAARLQALGRRKELVQRIELALP